MKALLILALYIAGIMDLLIEPSRGLCCLGIATILLEISY